MTNDLIPIFARVLQAEKAAAAAKAELSEHEMRLKPAISAAENERDKALAEIEAFMKDNGVLEEFLPHDDVGRWKLSFTTPRESVVGDAEAAPDEFVTRSLKKAEVAKYLKGLREAGQDAPNWCKLELGESKLTYKLEKVK